MTESEDLLYEEIFPTNKDAIDTNRISKIAMIATLIFYGITVLIVLFLALIVAVCFAIIVGLKAGWDFVT